MSKHIKPLLHILACLGINPVSWSALWLQLAVCAWCLSVSNLNLVINNDCRCSTVAPVSSFVHLPRRLIHHFFNLLIVDHRLNDLVDVFVPQFLDWQYSELFDEYLELFVGDATKFASMVFDSLASKLNLLEVKCLSHVLNLLDFLQHPDSPVALAHRLHGLDQILLLQRHSDLFYCLLGQVAFL